MANKIGKPPHADEMLGLTWGGLFSVGVEYVSAFVYTYSSPWRNTRSTMGVV